MYNKLCTFVTIVIHCKIKMKKNAIETGEYDYDNMRYYEIWLLVLMRLVSD
jgi:hypothetical protein